VSRLIDDLQVGRSAVWHDAKVLAWGIRAWLNARMRADLGT
jgi:hypothetical protein